LSAALTRGFFFHDANSIGHQQSAISDQQSAKEKKTNGKKR
jgi:hypothetical protein